MSIPLHFWMTSRTTDPCMPFGPSRPLLTRSWIRPRTPTTLPSLTPMSIPQPLLSFHRISHRAYCTLEFPCRPYLHKTQALWTQRSGSSMHNSSTLLGQSPLYGVLWPYMFLIGSRVFLVDAGSASACASHFRPDLGILTACSRRLAESHRPPGCATLQQKGWAFACLSIRIS